MPAWWFYGEKKIQPTKTNEHKHIKKLKQKQTKSYQNKHNQNIHQKASIHKTLKSGGYDTGFVLDPL